jgi:hypothetical protein
MGLRFKNTNIIGMVLIMKLKNLLLLLGVVTICSSCIGDTNNPTISAKITDGVCQPMTTANTCSITLTYNTGGQSGLIISTSSGNSFSDNFVLTGVGGSYCPTTNTSNTQSCIVTVTYTPTTTPITEDLVFALGSAKSNAITISNY